MPAPADRGTSTDGTVDDQRPFLSVTVLNYNYAHYLPVCLESILGQTMTDFELILINDCSTDDSRDVIARYAGDHRVVLVDHETNAGFVSSLIEGHERGRGRYLSVVSADDYVADPRAFEYARAMLEQHPEVALCYSGSVTVDEDGDTVYERSASDVDYVAAGADELRRLMTDSEIIASGPLIRRDAYRAVGGYDPRYRYAIDINMWLALCSAGDVGYIAKPLYAYRSHGSNMSNSLGAFGAATDEALAGVDAALARFPAGTLSDVRRVRIEGKRRALLAIPTHDIFSGRYVRGWKGYAWSARRHPALTVLQPTTIVLAVRTLLGARGWRCVEAVKRRLRPAR